LDSIAVLAAGFVDDNDDDDNDDADDDDDDDNTNVPLLLLLLLRVLLSLLISPSDPPSTFLSPCSSAAVSCPALSISSPRLTPLLTSSLSPPLFMYGGAATITLIISGADFRDNLVRFSGIKDLGMEGIAKEDGELDC